MYQTCTHAYIYIGNIHRLNGDKAATTYHYRKVCLMCARRVSNSDKAATTYHYRALNSH
jgi:hypothetical protein